MAAGEYRDNPTESRKACKYCGKVLHHQGVYGHQYHCKQRNPTERRQWLEKHAHGEFLPALARTMKAEVRAVPIQNYARNGTASDEGPRVHLEISLDQDKLNALLSSLRVENGK